jgi:hypothetical protein
MGHTRQGPVPVCVAALCTQLALLPVSGLLRQAIINTSVISTSIRVPYLTPFLLPFRINSDAIRDITSGIVFT